MTVTKWSPNLRPEEDSPIVPVWITIPNLPIHLHDQKALFCITPTLGKPLKVDNATLTFARPKAARVCIEVDVSKTLHQRIHVKHVDEDLFFQVLYEDPPSFCSSCHRLGHTPNSCKPEKLPERQVVDDVPPMKDKGKGVLNDWTTVHRMGKPPKSKVTWVQKPFMPQVNPCMPCHEESFKAGARRRPEVHFIGSKEVIFLDNNGLAYIFFDPTNPVVEPTSSQNVSLDLVKEAEEEASKAEILFEENPSSENKILLNQRKAHLAEMTNREFIFWKQKCNLKWLQEGDANTRFFHNLVKNRRRHQQINWLLNDEGKIVDKPDEMEKLVVHHYTTLLNQAEPSASPDLYEQFLDAIPSLVDQRHNDYLMCLPTEEEIKLIIWEMDPNSAAGPDDNGLWAKLMRAKYWRNGDIFETLTDSFVWKRISRANETASNACSFNEDGSVVWSPEANGLFSIKSAFDLCRPASPSAASFKHLWMKPQNAKVGVFTWKLFKRCLPLPEYLQRLGFQLPSICPFCKEDSLISKHVFIDSPQIMEIWRYFSACLGFLHSSSSSINQHFMNWWLRGNNNNNIHGFLRLHLPGIICWHIWKELNDLLYENKSALNLRSLVESISMFVRQWLLVKTPKRLWTTYPWLAAKQLLPSFPKAPKVRVVKWLAPSKGRLKINIDASFTPMSRRGAAILRDDEGRFVRAASFLISGSTPYQAELDAAIKGIQWALSFHPLLVYETDALEILRRLGHYTHYAFSPFPIDILAKLIFENDILKSHTLREGNHPADLLAKEDRLKDCSLI
ncbi:unnamed protein product [Cuscuta campestris]|uniref:RNase H type-1 domain-containing protein n=1 Tax=Cuscuta campestris TaxID=132261 RepID=A0A484N533_9ASTE|nr:unnamed protein product [Cuscuta campestris]